MQSAPNTQADLITISINLTRFKKFIYSPALWICIVIVGAVYTICRDFVLTPAQQAGYQQTSPTIQRSPLLSSMMMLAPKNDVSGAAFEVSSSRAVHITIKNSTGSQFVLNRLDGPVIDSFTESNVDKEVYLESGWYVLSLVAKKDGRARALVEVQ